MTRLEATRAICTPQSARSVRTAWAMSGPVGQGGLIALSASKARPACASSASSSSCAPAPFGRSAIARAGRRDRGDVGELERIAGRDQQALLAAGERDHHRVVQAGRVRDRVGIGALVVAVEPVQVNGRRHDLAAGEPPQAGFAAFRQAREPRPAFAQRPFQQRIVAAADDRRRRLGQRRGGQQARRHPAVERRLRKQPAAGDLGAGHRAVGHQLIELALGQPEIGGGLVGGQKIRHLHKPVNSCIWFQI